MTPLAHHLAKLLTLPLKKRGRSFSDREKSGFLHKSLTDIHCFEVTEIQELILETGDRLRDSEWPNEILKYFFLPAPKTWLEMQEHEKGRTYRVAYLLEEERRAINVSSFYQMRNYEVDGHSLTRWDFDNPGAELQRDPSVPVQIPDKAIGQLMATLVVGLILINTPRIIGRRTFFPHLGLEKRLTRAFGPGKFPLHAWTEIKLEVTKPPEIDDGEPHESHLTGRRALHFCRKHIRIRLGQLEYVSAHWRGDPAIGIKRSRYVVRP